MLKKNGVPYAYNQDGSINEKEAANVRYIFQKKFEYNEAPPKVLIDRVKAEAEKLELELTADEVIEKARLLVNEYIAEEMNELGMHP